MTNLDKVERFHRMKGRIKEVILRTIREKEIIHGEQAVAVRLPSHLQRHTRDYDVFSDTPKKDAIEAEEELDEEFGGDFFEVTPAEHPGTHKVRSKIDGRTYADFSEHPEKEVPSEVVQGKNYVTLAFIKKRLRAILKEKEKEFRHAKDRDTLNRIKIYERIREQQSLGILKQEKKQKLMNLISTKKSNLISNNLIKSSSIKKIKFI